MLGGWINCSCNRTMNCTFEEIRLGAHRCTRCGRLVNTTVLPIYAKCRSQEQQVVRSGHEQQASRPGDELKALLSWLGVGMRTKCGCQDHATYMNQMGVQWCQENTKVIVGWMLEAAQKRRWPKWMRSRLVAWGLVKVAIRRARRKANRV